MLNMNYSAVPLSLLFTSIEFLGRFQIDVITFKKANFTYVSLENLRWPPLI